MKKKLLCHLFLCFAFTPFAISVLAQNKNPVTVNHIAVYVKDLQVSTNFYKNIVGLDSMPEPFHDGRHTWFRIGEHSQLHIISGAAGITDHDKNSHLCFAVPSVEEFAKGLTKTGLHFEDWSGKSNAISIRVDGVKQIYFQDPDKYWVEINDDKY